VSFKQKYPLKFFADLSKSKIISNTAFTSGDRWYRGDSIFKSQGKGTSFDPAKPAGDLLLLFSKRLQMNHGVRISRVLPLSLCRHWHAQALSLLMNSRVGAQRGKKLLLRQCCLVAAARYLV